MKQLHVADVVQEDLLFKHHDQPPPVHFDSQDGCRERQLADSRLSLHVDSVTALALVLFCKYLCVDNLQLSRRKAFLVSYAH